MGLLTGLFRSSRKKVSLTQDNDMGAFRTQLNTLVESKDALSAEDISSKVEELKSITADLPETEEKSKLLRFLEDFKAVQEQDLETAKAAADSVADLFERLDTQAMKDTPENVGPVATEETETTEEVETETTEKPAEGEVVETDTTEEEQTDALPNSEYEWEEIYQYVKKRLAEEEGAQSTDGDCENTDTFIAEEPEEESVGVTDHAPVIPVTIQGSAKGGLEELFEKAKKGVR